MDILLSFSCIIPNVYDLLASVEQMEMWSQWNTMETIPRY